jgi:hypothetical protein
MERYVAIVKNNFADFKLEKIPQNYSKKPSNIMAKRVSRMAPQVEQNSEIDEMAEILGKRLNAPD